MKPSKSEINTQIRYQADEKPPPLVTFGLGVQLAVLCIAGVVLTPAIVIRAAGGSEVYLTWAVFAAVLVSAITTIIQAVRVGRFGAGYVLLMGTSGAFIAVCITAMAQGGPALMCTLIIISSLFQFVLAAKLSWLRRVLTPPVSGTVIMLIAVTVMPFVFDMFDDLPEGSSLGDASITALVTTLVIVGIALRSKGTLRLWAPVIGVIVGSVIAAYFGFYQYQLVADADWFGFGEVAWPGIDLSFGPTFWVLLPTFILVTLVGAIETIGDSVAIQRVSWRKPRAVDFRAVQGAVSADGLGNLLSGLSGTLPNTTYSTSIAVTELTGVGARRVGVVIGIVFLVFAFMPKFLAVILAIPGPVVAAYIFVLLALLFVAGMKIVIQDGVDYRKALVVGVSFWIGVGFQNSLIYPEFIAGFAGGILQNGMTAGGLTALVLTAFIELSEARRKKILLDLDVSSLPEIRSFLSKFVRTNNWTESMETRLQMVAEEVLLTLLEAVDTEKSYRMRIMINNSDAGAELEFVTSAGDGNLEDQLALLNETETTRFAEREMSLRLLKHLSSFVRHQQYHDTHIVTVNVANR